MKSEEIDEKKVEPQSVVDKEEVEEEEFYTLEELDDLENSLWPILLGSSLT